MHETESKAGMGLALMILSQFHTKMEQYRFLWSVVNKRGLTTVWLALRDEPSFKRETPVLNDPDWKISAC